MTISGSNSSIAGMDFQNLRADGVRQGRPHKPNPDQFLNQLSTDLNLTDAQKTQISDILKNAFNQNDNDSDDNGATKTNFDPKEKRAEMQAKMSQMNDAIKSVLTSDQATKFQSILDQMQTQRQQQEQQMQQTFSQNGSFSVLV